MSNPRRNFSMDPETERLLDTHAGDNHSELVRELLKAYYSDGVYDTTAAAITVKRQRLEAQKAAVQAEAEALDSELDALDEAEATTDEVPEPSHELRTALDACANIPAEKRTADNDAIQRQSSKVGMDADEFLTLLGDRRPTDKLGNPLPDSARAD